VSCCGKTDLALAPGEGHTQVVSGLGLGPEEVVLAVFDDGEALASMGNRLCWATERAYLPALFRGD